VRSTRASNSRYVDAVAVVHEGLAVGMRRGAAREDVGEKVSVPGMQSSRREDRPDRGEN